MRPLNLNASQRRNDFDVLASRAEVPYFTRAPYPADCILGPMEFQFAGAEYSLARNHSLIGDEPGLGKSCEGILISNALEAQSTLVICPASLRLNWEREVWLWSTLPNVETYPVLKSKDGVSNTANYVILSYALLRNKNILDAIMELRWDHMILDEAHALKDPKGNKRTLSICAPDCLPSVVGRITMLSGTILPNQPIECYNAIRLLNWDAIDRAPLDDFRNFYYDEGGGWVTTTTIHPKTKQRITKQHWSSRVRNVPINHADLQYRLRKHLMVRRLKGQVLHELPKKRWHVFPLPLDAAMRQALKHPGWTEVERLYEMDPGAFDRAFPIDGEIATARRLLGEAKAPAVADYIEEVLRSGVEKVVIGAWHRSVLAYLRERLADIGLVYMDGNTTPRARQNAVDKFQTNPGIRGIIGQMQTLGEGWTLTEAQDVIFAEPDWVPGKNDQLLDRIHRFGQKGSYALGHIPTVPNSFDERVLGAAIYKAGNIHKVLDA